MILTSDERRRQVGSGVLLRKRHYLAFKGVNLGKEVIKMPSTEEIERALRKCELPRLVRGTKHDDPGLRLRTAEVLGGRFYDEPEAVAALREMLREEEESVLEVVLKGLLRASEGCGIPPQVAPLLEEDSEVKVALELSKCREELFRICSGGFGEGVRKLALDLLGHVAEPEDVDFLLELCRSPEPSLRASALSALGKVLVFPGVREAGRLVEAFLSAVRDSSPEVRAEGIRGLGWTLGRECLEVVRSFLYDENPQVSEAALEVVCLLGDEDELTELLESPSEHIRDSALRSLAVLGPESLFRGLAKLMGSELEAWAVSRAKEVMEEPELWFEPEACAELEEALKNLEPEMRRNLEEVLR